jgi:hypothetical protein
MGAESRSGQEFLSRSTAVEAVRCGDGEQLHEACRLLQVPSVPSEGPSTNGNPKASDQPDLERLRT